MFKQFILYTHTNFNQSNVSNVIRTLPRIHCIVQFGWFFGRTKIFSQWAYETHAQPHTAMKWKSCLQSTSVRLIYFAEHFITSQYLTESFAAEIHTKCELNHSMESLGATLCLYQLNAIVVSTETAEMCSLHTTHATGVAT